MTADIIQFPEPRPWSKYTYDAISPNHQGPQFLQFGGPW